MTVIHTNTMLGVFAACTDAECRELAEMIFPPLFFSVTASLLVSSVQTGKALRGLVRCN